MFVPVSAKHFETAYLGRTAYMLTYAGTDVVVSNTYKTDGFGDIIGQTIGIYAFGQIIARDKFEGNGKILVDKLVHATLNLLLFLARRLMIKKETHLALLTLDMSIIRALTAEDADHRLIKQMLGCVRRRELFFIVFVEDIIGHILSGFEFEDDNAKGLNVDRHVTIATHLALDFLTREQVDGSYILTLMKLQIVEGVSGDSDVHRGRLFTEVGYHKQHL